MKKGIYKLFCSECGKEAPLNKEKSNENWNIYINKPCECGGVHMPKMVEEDDKE